MRRPLLGAAALFAVAAASTAIVAYTSAQDRARSQRQAVAVTTAFLHAWQSENWPAAAALTRPMDGLDAGAYLARTKSSLHVGSATFTVGTVTSKAAPHADFSAKLNVNGLGPFSYGGHLTLVKMPKVGWRVAFSESTVHPSLAPGTVLARVRDLPARGMILGPGGNPLAPMDVELGTNVVGRLAPMTASQAAATGGRAEVGDPVGVTGLQRVFEPTLGAVAEGSVVVQAQDGKTVETLAQFSGHPGSNVTTTFDLGIQRAAEAALAGVIKPAALVAIDTTTGAITAIVDHPLAGFPRAVFGSYPPGSTFKIITATAGLLAGRTAESTLDCPKSITVGGRTFVNAESEQFGRIPFIEAFARSCNTWFAGLVKSLPLTAVQQAAALYGFSGQVGTSGPLPLGGLGGYFPNPDSYAKAAGQAIGQDQVAVSPVQMASVAAAVAAGQWRQPYLTTPPPPGLAHHDVPVASELRQFMAAVVGYGTAAQAGLPAGTFGKTGTAEFGPGPKYKTHAWFVGFRGTTAFAVVVEGGGFGGEVAAPLAAKFLRLLGP